MSLQVWLPLTENINNYGITKATFEGSPTIDNNGKIGKCYYFNNSPLIAQFPVTTQFSTNDFSGFSWYYLNSSQSNAYVFHVGGDNSSWRSKFALSIQSGKWVICVNQTEYNPNITPVVGEWHHVGFVNTGTSLKFYIDGVLASTHTSATSFTPTNYIAIGARLATYPNTAYSISCKLNDVRLYNHALTNSEIQKIYNQEIYHYHLNDLVNGYKSNIKPRLPAEYQEVEYIEADGTQTLSLTKNYVFNTQVNFEIKFETLPGNTTYATMFSLGGSYDYPWVYANSGSSGYGANYLFLDGSNWKNGGTTEGIKVYKYYNKKYYNQHWNSITITTSYTYPLTCPSINIFRVGPSYPSKGRFYYLYLKDGEHSVASFIPCIRKSDNKPGVYDMINGDFIYSTDTNPLKYGPLVKAIPNTYIPIEYIESTGDAYIDTGWLPPADNWKTETIYYFNPVNTNDHSVAGTRTGVGKMINIYHEGFETWLGTQVPSPHYKANQEVYLVNSCINSSKLLYMDYGTGIFQITGSGTTTANTGTNTLPIFGFRESGGAVNWRFTGYLKFYRIWENNILIRDMRPCVRISDNKPGMYDLVNDAFYTNAGSGEFTWGTQNELIKYNGPGYSNNNGIQNVQTTMVLSTPRYGVSTKFGANDTPKIELSSATNIMPTLINCSVSFWYKKDSSSSSQSLIFSSGQTKYLVATKAADLYCQGIGLTAKLYKDNAEIPISSTTSDSVHYASGAITDNNWHHFVLTGCNLSSWTTSYINKYYNNNWPINGAVSDFRIFATALSANDVQELYKMGHIPS